MDNGTIIMLEKVKFLTHRIMKILEGSKICVIKADTEHSLFTSISRKNNDLALVLMDMDIHQKYAIDLLKETRRRVKSTPIIIMTSENKKKFFIEAMLQGATDFIIKPFTNELFIDKIQKYLSPTEFNPTEIITMDLNQYIKGELRKAEKGGFPLSLMFMNIENNSGNVADEIKANNFIFNHMTKLFWETDLFMRFAMEHAIGIFPFCSQENTEILKTKIEAKFNEIKEDNTILQGYDLVCAFLSYPHDTAETNKVFDLFISRINEKFQNIQINI